MGATPLDILALIMKQGMKEGSSLVDWDPQASASAWLSVRDGATSREEVSARNCFQSPAAQAQPSDAVVRG
jgi:hypothetical protein